VNKKKSVVKRKSAIKKQVKVKLEGSTPLPLFDKSLVPNPSVPTLFADIAQIVGRSDGFTQLNFYSKAPGVNVECARITIPTKTMDSLVEIYCKATGFVPKV
jgi:hypothetical protein